MPKQANRAAAPRKSVRGRPKTGAKTLSRNEILDAALQILDAQGEKAVSFRALGRKLGVTPMAISHHVGSRQEMFRSLVERVYANIAEPTDFRDSTDALRALLVRYCECVVAHPSLAQSIFADQSLYSGQLVVLTRQVHDGIAALNSSNETSVEVMVNVVVDYTHGFAISAAAGPVGAQSIERYLEGLTWLLSSIK